MPIVSVLWGLALLGAASLSLMAAGTVEYRLVGNALRIMNDDAAGEAAIALATLALLDPRSDRRWRVDGAPQAFDFDGRRIVVSVQDELGRIDLNQAEGALLVRLFESVGLDPAASDALVDKILDWRDANPLRRLNGAKGAEYREAGYEYGPRNGPFQSLDELKLVMGMTPEIFARVEGALTVYSGHPRFDPQVAPAEALLALPAMGAAQAAALMASRALPAPGPADAASASPNGIGDPLMALKGRAFTILAHVQAADHVATRKATIRISGNPIQPYWVLNWQRR